ncbi:MAG: carboxypeptidase regulatory-like domain-containing protein [Candidatus Sulfotelmatobacter sp.]
MSNQKALCAVLLVLLVCLFSPLLHGQATGSFSGTVSDNSGAVLAGAKVTVIAQATNASREALTDDTGHFLIPLLGVADYTIKVDAKGFKPSEARNVRLQIDEHRELDFKLVPASVSTSVEVNATEVAVETANPTLGQVITAEEVAELPLNGRNFVQLATLTPGTTASTSPVSFFNGAASSEASTRGSFSLSVGGSREQSTDWLLDGNDNNQLDEGGIAIFSSIDDIQEFKVLTYNYSAEYGERAGPTVLVTTKSGSNQFHGSLFEFFRNTKLDARSYFATSVEKFNLNQFGGSLGGPIKKDKTFFFVDYQAKMQRHGIPFTGLIPSAAMITPDPNGDFDYSNDPFGNPRGSAAFPNLTNPFSGTPFQCNAAGNAVVPNADGSQTPATGGSTCNIIPAAMVNPIGLAVLNLYPATNANNSNLDYNFTSEPVRRLNEGTFDIRLDHNFSSKDSVFARFSYDQATNFVPGGSPTWSEANAFGSNQYIDNHGRNAVLTETHIFTPSMINQFTVGFSRIFNHILSFGTGSCEAARLVVPVTVPGTSIVAGQPAPIPGADVGGPCDSYTGYPASLNQASNDCVGCGMTSFGMSSYWSVGDRGYAPYQGGTNVYSASDTLDLIRGKHNVRVGLVFRANEMNVRNNASQDGYVSETGQWTGDDIADTLIGELGNFAAHDQTFLGATSGRRWKLFRPFVQDDWRVSNNLTVNLGLAWSLATPETEVENRQSNFDFPTGTWYVPKGSPTLSSCTVCIPSDGRVGIQFDKTAVEPRIGFAWKPAGSQATVIRGGYGILHDSAWSQGGQGLWQNPPYYAEVDPCAFCLTYGTTAFGLSNGFLPLYTSPVNPQAYTGTIQSQNRDFKQGMVQQYNLNVERQLPGDVVLTAGYAGTRSVHILVSQVNENTPQPGACGTVPGYTLGCSSAWPAAPNFPYAPYQYVNSNNSVGNARYDSLEVKAETKSARHGLYALLGYTWSRTFDSGMPDGLGTPPGAIYWPLPGTQKLDWGLSQLNLNDSFTASILYDLPFGKGKHFGSTWSGPVNTILGSWQVNLIERATSGFPLFVVDSANNNFAGPGVSGTYFGYNFLNLNRPNEVSDPNKGGGGPGCPAQVHTLQNWFNPCAFAHALPGELGTAARAPVYGPRFVNTDFSIVKDFPFSFREGMNLQFRAEFFNLFNHPQFYMAGIAGFGEQDINTPSSFGVVNQTVNNPRLIQLALKLKF